jgi:hypothetical protein
LIDGKGMNDDRKAPKLSTTNLPMPS